jgi:hypothetical protein
MKLYNLLFETEEYFKYHIQGNGLLNSEFAREFFNLFKKRSSFNLLGYQPNGMDKTAAKETSEPNNLAILEPTTSIENKYFVVVNIKNNEIILTEKSKNPLMDPRITLQLKSILKVFPEFGNFVVKQEYNNENLGLLKNILTNIKSFSGRYKEYSRKEELYKDYKFEILKDVTEIDWYHATKRSNLASIKKVGIIPSKQFQHPQEYGWTTLNLDLQNAVYLTYNQEYASQIAETIAAKYEEPAIVLKISGHALKDTTKLVVDEDVLRNNYDGSVSPNQAIPGMPEYFSSILHNLKSIGYTGVISPNYVSFVERINPASIENHFNENKICDLIF